MKKRKKERYSRNFFFFMALRYLVILLLALNLSFIYQVLTPPTSYLSVKLLRLFFNEVLVVDTVLIINFKTVIELIPACIGGLAYFLLLILNFSVSMSLAKRFFSLLLSITALFVINVLRISLFSLAYYHKIPVMIFIHSLSWIFLSTILTVLIWLLTAKLFSIDKIPFYSDIKILTREMKRGTR